MVHQPADVQPGAAEAERCRVVYISPIKALAVDVERNLRAPLAGIAEAALRLGAEFHEPSIAIRTGDTAQTERARFARQPADILITTPESLYLMLTSNAREMLRSVEAVIVDEIHALVPTKRGSHLALSLERLEQLAGRRLQRIGLSATQRPLEEVARFLGGCEPSTGNAEESSAASEDEVFSEFTSRHRSRPFTGRVHNRGCQRAEEARSAHQVPVEDMSRLDDMWRRCRAVPLHPFPAAAIDLERDPSPAAGAGALASLDADFCEQPPAGGTHCRCGERTCG